MAPITAPYTKEKENVISAATWLKPLQYILTTLIENLQYMATMFISQHHRRISTDGLCTLVLIRLVHLPMWGAQLMHAGGGQGPRRLV